MGSERVVLVTGGSQGIGECIAHAFARDGATVAVVASSKVEKAEAVAAAIRADGGKAGAYAADVRDEAALAAVAAAVERDLGPIAVLVNSAGVFFPTPVGATGAEARDRTIDINLKGTWNAINVVGPLMKARGHGKIINISSVCATMGFGGYAIYCATKAGVSMMTKALAIELAPHGINVNAIAPGNTRTEMNADIRTSPELKPMLEAIVARTPTERVYSEPEDMAAIAVFLASPGAIAIHGTTILADEGFSAGF